MKPLVLLFLAVSGVTALPQFPYGEENPSILHDARRSLLDGSYRFQYETQDGIRHDSFSTPEKLVSGIYSYTDPTGLKVSWSYNAGVLATSKSSASSSSVAKPVTRDYVDDYSDTFKSPSPSSRRGSAARASFENYPKYTEARTPDTYRQSAQAPAYDYYDYYDSGFESTRDDNSRYTYSSDH